MSVLNSELVLREQLVFKIRFMESMNYLNIFFQLTLLITKPFVSFLERHVCFFVLKQKKSFKFVDAMAILLDYEHRHVYCIGTSCAGT
jgi:hypothetical protein